MAITTSGVDHRFINGPHCGRETLRYHDPKFMRDIERCVCGAVSYRYLGSHKWSQWEGGTVGPIAEQDPEVQEDALAYFISNLK